MVYFANSKHILFPVRTYFLYNHTSSSCFAIRGGTAWKSCEGWMGPNPKGTHLRVCVSPRFAIRGRSALWICEARICFIRKEAYLRLDAVHAAAWRMDVVSIVNGNVCGCFRECWHERFLCSVIFCKVRCVLWSFAGTLTTFRKSLSEHRLVLN
jgi:hypothetical protein